jgi:hypothetical protein
MGRKSRTRKRGRTRPAPEPAFATANAAEAFDLMDRLYAEHVHCSCWSDDYPHCCVDWCPGTTTYGGTAT